MDASDSRSTLSSSTTSILSADGSIGAYSRMPMEILGCCRFHFVTVITWFLVGFSPYDVVKI